jgi:hypothetical protein
MTIENITKHPYKSDFTSSIGRSSSSDYSHCKIQINILILEAKEQALKVRLPLKDNQQEQPNAELKPASP